MSGPAIGAPCNWSPQDVFPQFGDGDEAVCVGLPVKEAAIFVARLRACSKNKDLRTGALLHCSILKHDLLSMCSDALIMMYANCREIDKAQALLDMAQTRDIITWTGLIAAFVRDGQNQQALDSFLYVQQLGIHPNAVTCICALKACAAIRDIEKGRKIHDLVVRLGLLEGNVVLGTALVDMYAKCGALSDAHGVLQKLPYRDTVCWNALMAGYCQEDQPEQMFKCFEIMQTEGIEPNSVTYICILKACALIQDLEKGKQIHQELARQGMLLDDSGLANTLVKMYVKCGALSEARVVLETLSSCDVISWNAVIAGYAQDSKGGEQALNCYEQMQSKSVHPNAITYVSILKACASTRALDKGRQIHNEIMRQGLLLNDLVIGNALVDMYAKCGALAKAHEVLGSLPLRDVVSWSALIAGYAEEGLAEQAIKCLNMMQREGIHPNSVTYVSILKSCGAIKDLGKGKDVHNEIIEQDLLEENVVLGNALVDMYAKCGAICKAWETLENLTVRDVTSWTALMAGCTELCEYEAALECLSCMQYEGILPNAVTYISILKVCGSVGALCLGEQIHDEVIRQGILKDKIRIGNALVDLYAKCGNVSKAHNVLEKLHSRDVISWNTLVTGYAQQGQVKQAFACLKSMQHEGISPNPVTYLCMLNMCSHLGLVEEGCTFFLDMSARHGLDPDLQAYICMIDLFGRAGHLQKALSLIEEMPFPGDSDVWHALLGACRNAGDVTTGRWAFQQALFLNKSDGPAYVLMAENFAIARMQDKLSDIKRLSIRNKASLQLADDLK